MRQTIDAIRDAIEKECWLPALALALTIPDVMGQIAYPKYVSPHGKRLVGKQYKQWFHENVEPRFADHTGFDENWRARRPYFSADMCYQLRCELLHSGSDDIDFEYGEREPGRDYTYDFELRAHACDSHGSYWADPHGNERIEEHVHVCIDIKTLCDALCDSAERCLQNVNEGELAKHEVRVVDVAEYAGLNHRKLGDKM